MLRTVLDFNLSECAVGFYRRHREQLHLYLLCLAIVLLAFGAKLTTRSYAGDDFVMLSGEKSGMTFYNGRWLAEWLNNRVFRGSLRILPYFNTMLALGLFVFSGLMSARIWQVRDRFSAGLIACLTTITPYMAHNLYFNMNTPVAIGVTCGVVAVFLFYRSWKWFPVSFALLFASLGIYQSVSQIVMILVLGRLVRATLLSDADRLRHWARPFLKACMCMVLLVLAYRCNVWIVTRIITTDPTLGQYAYQSSVLTVFRESSWANLPANLLAFHRNLSVDRYFYNFLPFLQILKVWQIPIGFLAAYAGLALFSLASILRTRPTPAKISILKILAGLVGMWGFFLILFIPEILVPRIYMPTRAFFPTGWSLGALLMLSCLTRVRLVRSLAQLAAIVLVAFFALYISAFYEVAHRRTQADILCLNQIATRIRSHPSYTFSKANPPGLFLLGNTSALSVKVPGWTLITEHPFAYAENAYAAFDHFTNLDFRRLTAQRQKEIAKQLSELENLPEYPAPGSIRILNGDIAIVLNAEALAPYVDQP